MTLQNSTLKINRNEAIIQSVLNDAANFSKIESNFNCEIENIEVSIKDILMEENIQFIDVRETHEQPKVENIEVTYIPIK